MVKKQKVLKTDSSIEPYIHTKVLATLCHCFSGTEVADISLCEQLAEVITHYVYQQEENPISSETILSIIKAALTETGYQNAAEVLCEHHNKRCVNRHRLEILQADLSKFKSIKDLHAAKKHRWNKSDIARNLMESYNLDRQTARTIASMVEDKVFALGITKIPSSLLKQLILNDAASVLTAEDELQTV